MIFRYSPPVPPGSSDLDIALMPSLRSFFKQGLKG